jgi:hypothetical protein
MPLEVPGEMHAVDPPRADRERLIEPDGRTRRSISRMAASDAMDAWFVVGQPGRTSSTVTSQLCELDEAC